MITDKEYYEITNCTSILGFNLPNISLKEIQEFLARLGYIIYVHETPCKVEFVNMDMGGSVERTGKFTEEKRKRILALKSIEVEGLFHPLPARIDSEEAKEMDFRTVFNKEIKKKLLGL